MCLDILFILELVCDIRIHLACSRWIPNNIYWIVCFLPLVDLKCHCYQTFACFTYLGLFLHLLLCSPASSVWMCTRCFHYYGFSTIWLSAKPLPLLSFSELSWPFLHCKKKVIYQLWNEPILSLKNPLGPFLRAARSLGLQKENRRPCRHLSRKVDAVHLCPDSVP